MTPEKYVRGAVFSSLMRTVRFVDQPSDLFGPLRIRRRRDFEVEGAGFFEAGDDALFAPLAVVKDASLTSLRHAVAAYNKHYEGGDDLSRPGFDGDGVSRFCCSSRGRGCPVFHSVEFLDLSRWPVRERFV